MLKEKIKQLFALTLAAATLLQSGVLAAEAEPAADTEADTVAADTAAGDTSAENDPIQKYKVDFMDEVRYYDYGKFMDGFSLAEKEISNKAAIDLLIDLEIYVLESDYKAVSSGSKINTTAAEYNKYDKSVTKADFYYVLNQLMLGDMEKSSEYKTFGEQDKVTMLDVVNSLADLLGYGSVKEQLGLQRIVNDNSLLKGVGAYNPGKTLSFGELSVILVNTLEANGVQESHSVNNSAATAANDMFMERQLNIYKVEGFVNAVGAQNLFKNQARWYDEVEIDRVKYQTGNVDADEFLGKYVVAYFYLDEDRDQNILRHVETHKKDTSITIDLHDVKTKSGSLVLYEDDEEFKTVDISDIEYIMYNGYATTDTSVLSSLSGKDGDLLLGSTTRSKKYNVAIVNKYEYFVVHSVIPYEQRIALRDNAQLNGSSQISMRDYDEIECVLDGESAEYSELQTGTTIRVMACPENKYIQIIANSGSVSGKIDAYADGNIVTIAGNEYRISETYLNNTSNETLSTGSRGTFYVSADNYIAGYKSGNEASYAYLYRAINDEDEGNVKVELFTQDGKWKQYVVKKKNVNVDGKYLTATETYNYLYTSTACKNLCRYKVNGKDELTFLDTMLTEAVEKNDDKRMRIAYEGNVKQSWRCTWFRSDIGYRIRSSSVVFVLPNDIEKKDDYEVRSGATISSDENEIYMKLYCPDEMNICDVVIIGESVAGLASEIKKLFYIQSVSQMFDEKTEETCYAIKGINFDKDQAVGEGTSMTLKVKPDQFTKLETTYPGAFATGTVMDYAADSENYISTIAPVVYNNTIGADFHDKDNVYYQKFNGTVTAVSMDDGYFAAKVLGKTVVSGLETCICIDSADGSARAIGLGELIVGERIYVNRIAGGARFAVVVR